MLYYIIGLFILLIIFICYYYQIEFSSKTRCKKWTVLSTKKWKEIKNTHVNKNEKRCCVVSGDNRDSEDIILLKKINKKYCERNNYDFIFFDNDDKYNLHKISPYWRKIKVIYEIMKKCQHEYVMWIDSDACFHDFDFRIETLFEIYQDNIFIMSGDIKSNISIFDLGVGIFNAGVFMIRNNEKGRAFVKKWLSLYPSDKWLKHKDEDSWICRDGLRECKFAGIYYEQGAGYKLMNNLNFSKHVLQLPDKALQGNYDPMSSSYTMHFAGDNKANIKRYYNRYFHYK